MDTIKELFYGNIHPFERDVPKDSEGDKLAKLTIRHENALRATLNESEAELLEKYKDAMTELSCLVSARALSTAFGWASGWWQNRFTVESKKIARQRDVRCRANCLARQHC